MAVIDGYDAFDAVLNKLIEKSEEAGRYLRERDDARRDLTTVERRAEDLVRQLDTKQRRITHLEAMVMQKPVTNELDVTPTNTEASGSWRA